MQRFHQIILIGSFLPLCWLGMMGVHELGHAIAGWATGGTVTKVVLHPFANSKTDVSPNPEPHIVVWSGPLVGVSLPILAWGTAIWTRLRGEFLIRFFAGFCLIANGLYIGIGSLSRIGDAGDMLSNDSPIWSLWLFGCLTVPTGLLLWHRSGEHFGLGNTAKEVSPLMAYASLLLFVCVLAACLALSPRL